MSAFTWLLDRMGECEDHPALIWNAAVHPYGSLLEQIRTLQAELAALAIGAGQVVAMEADFSPTAVALLLALFDLGAVVVPLTPAAGPEQDGLARAAEVQAIVSMDAEDGWTWRLTGAVPQHPLTRRLLDTRQPGLVLFTSGSTGTSKAALHDVGALLEKFRVRRHRLVTITFLLLDHIGGINTLLYTLANGGTAVTISRRDPDLVCRLIEQHRVELLPATPTFLNLLLLSEAHTRHDLSSLKRISYGTEVMPETTLRRLRTVFPSVDLVQTYGLTEVGILRARSKEPGSLLMKVGGEGFETRVVDGILFIRAQSAMLGYLNAPSPFDEEGWFNTQDCVEVEGEYIRIIGRKSDIINVGGEKVYPAEVESVLMQMDNIRDATVYAEPNPIAGQIVAARLALDHPEDLFSLKRRVRSFCRDHLAPFKVPARIEVIEGDLAGPRYKKLRPALRLNRLGFSGEAATPHQRGDGATAT